MHRFFVESESVINDTIRITGNDVNHITNVLRMKKGEEISVLTGQDKREYRCIIEEITKDYVLCRICFVKESDVELPCRVVLFQGLPKGDKMETVVQKSVELGVSEIVPIRLSRCIVKPDEKRSVKKVARWNEIAESAAKQSKRAFIPKVDNIMDLKEALENIKDMNTILIPYEMATDFSYTREVINGIKTGDDIAFFIGPEGGFTTDEIELLKNAGGKTITLGRRILRTETAALTFLSWLVYRLED